jgi:ATP-dependent 26S proteasome regulatory subunit
MFAIRNNRKKVITKDFLDAIDKIIESAKVTLTLK